MKQRLSQYIAENYAPGSEPDPRTVIARAKKRQLHNVESVFMEGGLWYVYLSSTPENQDIANIEREIQCRQ